MIIKRLFASFEFAATVLIGMLIYLWCAVSFAARIFVTEVHGLFRGSIATWRVRVHGALADTTANDPKPALGRGCSEAAECGPVGRGRFSAWLN